MPTNVSELPEDFQEKLEKLVNHIVVESPNFDPIVALVGGELVFNKEVVPPITLMTIIAEELQGYHAVKLQSDITEAAESAQVELTAPEDLAADLEQEYAITRDAINMGFQAVQIMFPVYTELYGVQESSAEAWAVAEPGDWPDRLAAKTFREFVEGCFGCYRKDLAKAVVRAGEPELMKAWLHRDTMPIDWIVDYLNADHDKHPAQEMILQEGAYRSFVKAIKPGDSKRILWDSDPLLDDTVLMWVDNHEEASRLFQDKKIKSIRDIHDRLLTLEHKKAHVEYLIPDGAESLCASLESTFNAQALTPTIIRNSSHASDVGAKLRNCCGASFNRERGEEGKLLFVTLDYNDEPYALCSFSKKDNQFSLSELKIQNNVSSPELETLVEEAITRLVKGESNA